MQTYPDDLVVINLQVLLSGANSKNPPKMINGSAKNAPNMGSMIPPIIASNRLKARKTKPNTRLDTFMEKHSILFIVNSLYHQETSGRSL